MNRLSLSISCVQFKYLSGMRERELRGGRWINWTTTWYQVESYSFLHDEIANFHHWVHPVRRVIDRDITFFILVNWNESFLFNLTIILFRAVKHFHHWSHHRLLKSRQMNRLFLSINYLQFISSWDWRRGESVCKKGVRRWIKWRNNMISSLVIFINSIHLEIEFKYCLFESTE